MKVYKVECLNEDGNTENLETVILKMTLDELHIILTSLRLRDTILKEDTSRSRDIFAGHAIAKVHAENNRIERFISEGLKNS